MRILGWITDRIRGNSGPPTLVSIAEGMKDSNVTQFLESQIAQYEDKRSRFNKEERLAHIKGLVTYMDGKGIHMPEGIDETYVPKPLRKKYC